ncbi:hypothetical protein BKP37_18740 [Anaerobacillus alkalilacustris]|uniref:Pilus assembly protein PilM n=1 Tax=Anaerobacillus alkalilacustris TaxID=393763 RepID=A0A1S2LDJ4_9BACI|nr:pilus assembly protein PilM [Anaerobacillus alkalilacustris]OIJ10569.1 hypothetical protein BKP37_18740 [Anaerobacillus alkalilacustris]
MVLFRGKKQMRTAIIIKDHVIRFVHAKRADLASIDSFGERYLPTGVIHDGKIVEWETLEGILHDCIEEWQLKKHYVQFIVPDAYTVLRHVQVPLSIKVDEIKGYLYTVIGETVHLPFDEATFDIHNLGEKDGQREVLLIATPEKKVQEYVNLLTEVKVKPNAADISALSLYRLLHSLDRDNKNDHFLFVQVDLLSINITIFHNQKPVFMRHIKLSTEDKWRYFNEGTEEVSWEGNQSEIENQIQDIITEVDRIMNYYRYSMRQGKYRVTKLVVIGDHPYLIDISKKFQKSFGVDIETITKETIKTMNGKEIPERFYEIVGLALKKEVHDVS